jgi:hypothetical protein
MTLQPNRIAKSKNAILPEVEQSAMAGDSYS